MQQDRADGSERGVEEEKRRKDFRDLLDKRAHVEGERRNPPRKAGPAQAPTCRGAKDPRGS